MKFSRIAPYAMGFLSIGLLATAAALPAEKRQLSGGLSGVLSIVTGLLSTALSLLGE